MDYGELKNSNKSKGDFQGLTPDFLSDLNREISEKKQSLKNKERLVEESKKETIDTETPLLPPSNIDNGEMMVSEHDKTIEDQNPEIAADGHKLEKEWVKKTKVVIEATKDDPREEEIQIEELKADYLKKRFNRAIGDRN